MIKPRASEEEETCAMQDDSHTGTITRLRREQVEVASLGEKECVRNVTFIPNLG
jgi:hypothetical protein